MINLSLNIILNILTTIVNIIMLPLDLIIISFLPDVSNSFDKISDLLDLILNGLAFAVSLSGLSNYAISLVILYIIFRLTVPFAVYGIKLLLKWYNYIKP